MRPPTRHPTRVINLTQDLRSRLQNLSTGSGGYQTVCSRIQVAVRIAADGAITARVRETDIDHLKSWRDRADAGGWQDWARDALANNGL